MAGAGGRVSSVFFACYAYLFSEAIFTSGGGKGK